MNDYIYNASDFESADSCDEPDGDYVDTGEGMEEEGVIVDLATVMEMNIRPFTRSSMRNIRNIHYNYNNNYETDVESNGAQNDIEDSNSNDNNSNNDNEEATNQIMNEPRRTNRTQNVIEIVDSDSDCNNSNDNEEATNQITNKHRRTNCTQNVIEIVDSDSDSDNSILESYTGTICRTDRNDTDAPSFATANDMVNTATGTGSTSVENGTSQYCSILDSDDDNGTTGNSSANMLATMTVLELEDSTAEQNNTCNAATTNEKCSTSNHNNIGISIPFYNNANVLTVALLVSPLVHPNTATNAALFSPITNDNVQYHAAGMTRVVTNNNWNDDLCLSFFTGTITGHDGVDTKLFFRSFFSSPGGAISANVPTLPLEIPSDVLTVPLESEVVPSNLDDGYPPIATGNINHNSNTGASNDKSNGNETDASSNATDNAFSFVTDLGSKIGENGTCNGDIDHYGDIDTQSNSLLNNLVQTMAVFELGNSTDKEIKTSHEATTTGKENC